MGLDAVGSVSSREVSTDPLNFFTYGSETVDDTVKVSRAMVAATAKGSFRPGKNAQSDAKINLFHTRELLGMPDSAPIHVHGNHEYRIIDHFEEPAVHSHLTRESKILAADSKSALGLYNMIRGGTPKTELGFVGVTPEERVSFRNGLVVGGIRDEIHMSTGKEAGSVGHKFVCPERGKSRSIRDKFTVTPVVEIPISCDEPVPENLMEVLNLVRQNDKHVFLNN